MTAPSAYVPLTKVAPGDRIYLGGRRVGVLDVRDDPFAAGSIRVELDNGTHLVVERRNPGKVRRD